MVRHAVAIVAIMLILDALVLTVMFIIFWNDIAPLNIVGTMIVFLFVINAFILAWLLDLLKPIIDSIGNRFGGLGGLLGR